jgi:hypothetical protein
MTVHGMNHSGYALMLDEAGMTIDTGDDEAKRVKEERRSMSVPKSRHAKSNGEEGWDLLWIAVNESGLSKSQKAWNSKVRLSRNEFLEVLVRGAIMGKAPDDMPRCVGELVQDMLNLGRQPHASLILHDANAFRRTYCYLKEVCAVLKHHSKSLRNLYDVYAEVGTGAVDVHGSSKLLSIAEWVALVRDLAALTRDRPEYVNADEARSRRCPTTFCIVPVGADAAAAADLTSRCLRAISAMLCGVWDGGDVEDDHFFAAAQAGARARASGHSRDRCLGSRQGRRA